VPRATIGRQSSGLTRAASWRQTKPPQQAAVRETKEETTLVVSSLKEINLSLDNPVVAYYTRDYSGDVKIDFEHTDWAWVTRKDIETYDLASDTLDLYEWALNNGK